MNLLLLLILTLIAIVAHYIYQLKKEMKDLKDHVTDTSHLAEVEAHSWRIRSTEESISDIGEEIEVINNNLELQKTAIQDILRIMNKIEYKKEGVKPEGYNPHNE